MGYIKIWGLLDNIYRADDNTIHTIIGMEGCYVITLCNKDNDICTTSITTINKIANGDADGLIMTEPEYVLLEEVI